VTMHLRIFDAHAINRSVPEITAQGENNGRGSCLVRSQTGRRESRPNWSHRAWLPPEPARSVRADRLQRTPPAGTGSHYRLGRV